MPPPELKLGWRRGKDLPFKMSDYPSMVVLKGKVYIGGGYAGSDVEDTTVIVYDPQRDSCGTLPPYTWMNFSMAVVNNQLVLVGGQDVKNITKMTNILGVWNESSRRWTHSLPPMTTACYRPTVVTHKDRWLVVIGGGGDGGRLFKVEILNTLSKQWHNSTPMPEILGCTRTLTATIGSTCYLMGGYLKMESPNYSWKRVISVSLDELVSQAQVSKPVSAASPPTPSPWQASVER